MVCMDSSMYSSSMYSMYSMMDSSSSSSSSDHDAWPLTYTYDSIHITNNIIFINNNNITINI